MNTSSGTNDYTSLTDTAVALGTPTPSSAAPDVAATAPLIPSDADPPRYPGRGNHPRRAPDLSIGAPNGPLVIPDMQALGHNLVGVPVVEVQQREPNVDAAQLPVAMFDLYTYLRKGEGHMKCRPWGEEWVRCIEEFVRIERADKYPVCYCQLGSFEQVLTSFSIQILSRANSVTSQGRPKLVGTWMRGGRKTGKNPIDDLDEFVNDWWTWWRNMQPGRLFELENPPASTYNDNFTWDGLDRTGSCGIVLVMVSLVWWGEAVVDREGECLWRKAVADVAWVFGELSKVKDRAAESSESEESKAEAEREPSQCKTTRKRRSVPSDLYILSFIFINNKLFNRAEKNFHGSERPERPEKRRRH